MFWWFFPCISTQQVRDHLYCTFIRRRLKFLNYDVFLSLYVVLILANSADPNELQHNAAFHLGRHCLPKYLFRGFSIQRVRGGQATHRTCTYHVIFKASSCMCTCSLSYDHFTIFAL